jgi:hypothetical protein
MAASPQPPSSLNCNCQCEDSSMLDARVVLGLKRKAEVAG